MVCAGEMREGRAPGEIAVVGPRLCADLFAIGSFAPWRGPTSRASQVAAREVQSLVARGRIDLQRESEEILR